MDQPQTIGLPKSRIGVSKSDLDIFIRTSGLIKTIKKNIESFDHNDPDLLAVVENSILKGMQMINKCIKECEDSENSGIVDKLIIPLEELLKKTIYEKMLESQEWVEIKRFKDTIISENELLKLGQAKSSANDSTASVDLNKTTAITIPNDNLNSNEVDIVQNIPVENNNRQGQQTWWEKYWQPKAWWDKFYQYITLPFTFPNLEGDPGRVKVSKIFSYICGIIQIPIDITEKAIRGIFRGLFFVARHPSCLLPFYPAVDDNDENLTKIQYVIKEIGIGFDNYFKHMFYPFKHPLDALLNTMSNLYNLIETFLEQENKWEFVKDSFNQAWEKFKEHPIRYSTEIVLYIVTIILTITLPVTTGGGGAVVASLEPLAESSAMLNSFSRGISVVSRFSSPILTATPILATPIVAAIPVVSASIPMASSVTGVAVSPFVWITSVKNTKSNIDSIDGVSGQYNNPRSSQNIIKTIELLKSNLGLYNMELDHEIYAKIRDKIKILENQLVETNQLDKYNRESAEKLKSNIRLLKSNLDMYEPQEEMYNTLQIKIAALEKNLETHQKMLLIEQHNCILQSTQNKNSHKLMNLSVEEERVIKEEIPQLKHNVPTILKNGSSQLSNIQSQTDREKQEINLEMKRLEQLEMEADFERLLAMEAKLIDNTNRQTQQPKNSFVEMQKLECDNYNPNSFWMRHGHVDSDEQEIESDLKRLETLEIEADMERLRNMEKSSYPTKKVLHS